MGSVMRYDINERGMRKGRKLGRSGFGVARCLASPLLGFYKGIQKNETMLGGLHADCLHELCIRLEAPGSNDFIRNFDFDDIVLSL